MSSPLLIKIASTPNPAHQSEADRRYSKTGRPNVYENPFREYHPHNMNVGRWKQEEHHRFLEALRLYGREWKQVQQHVATRTSTQARSHAQKFLGKLEKRNITLQQFLDKYFERPDELEDDFFSGIEDNDMVYNRKKQFKEQKEQQEEETLKNANLVVKQPRSYKEVEINGFTITPTPKVDFKSEEVRMDKGLLNPTKNQEELNLLLSSTNHLDNKFERISDAYEGDDQFQAVSPSSPSKKSRRKKSKGKIHNTKIVLPTQSVPPSNYQPYAYGEQSMPYLQNQEPQQFYNPYDNEPYKPTNLIPRKSTSLETPINPYFQQQQWQGYPMQTQSFVRSPVLQPLKNEEAPAVSAIPPMNGFQSNLVAPPPPPHMMDFRNFIQFGENEMPIPGSEGNEGQMQNLQQFEPPSVLNNQSVAAAMMFSQQMSRNHYGMYEMADFPQYQETAQSNFYFPQQQFSQYNQFSFQNESQGDESHQQSPRNRTNSMPDAPSNHDQFLKRSAFCRPYDNSEDIGGSIAANDESIGPMRFIGNVEVNGQASKFKGTCELKQGDKQIAAKD